MNLGLFERRKSWGRDFGADKGTDRLDAAVKNWRQREVEREVGRSRAKARRWMRWKGSAGSVIYAYIYAVGTGGTVVPLSGAQERPVARWKAGIQTISKRSGD
jgi:hypothetical protein